MIEGAFALIDCLGFKGIWRQIDATVLLAKLKRIESAVVEKVKGETPAFKYLSYGPVNTHVKLLSDTVAISLQYTPQTDRPVSEPQKDLLVALLCGSISAVLDLFIEGEPALVLRGCITFGNHLCESNFLVGPAVDEAAEAHNLAEGAFVWLLPDAALRMRRFQTRALVRTQLAPAWLIARSLEQMNDPEGLFDSLRESFRKNDPLLVGEAWREVTRTISKLPVVIDPYPIPLKGGTELLCPVINPLAFTRRQDARLEVIQRYERAMSDQRPAVQRKSAHTLKFLHLASKETARFELEIKDWPARTVET